jgi:hypothetical protein
VNIAKKWPVRTDYRDQVRKMVGLILGLGI